MVYAVARLLPSHLTRDLTFSTFEPYHETYTRRNAHIVNTVINPDKPQSFRLEGLGDTSVAYNTFTFEKLGRFVPNEALSAFVRYLVELLAAGDISRLDDNWNTYARLGRSEQLPVETLIAIWQADQRIAELGTTPMANADLLKFLCHPQWRPRVLSSDAGRRQAIDIAVSWGDTLPDWWPESANDLERFPDFTCRLADIRELLVERMATALSREHQQELNVCIDLLKPLQDATFTGAFILDKVAQRLESISEPPLYKRLPWSARHWIIKQIFQLNPDKLNKRWKTWLRTSSFQELSSIYQTLDVDTWKAEATLLYLGATSESWAAVFTRLTETPSLLRRC